jgi:hypothetical protein
MTEILLISLYLIFHVHCRITVHCRRSVAPTIAVNAVAVALLSRCPCPLPPSLVDCCLAVGSHCNRRANHRCHRCRSVAPSIAVAIVALLRLQSRAVAVASLSHLPSPLPLRCRCVLHRLCRKCLAAGGHYNGVVCSLPRWHPPAVQEEKGGVPPHNGWISEVLAPTLLLYLNLSHDGVAVSTTSPTSSSASSLSSPAVTTTSSSSSSVAILVARVLLLFVI